MRITQFIPSFGRQLTIIGSLLIVFGFVIQFYEAGWSLNVDTTTFILLMITIAVIIGGIYLYQRLVFSKRLREQVLRAKTITTAPNNVFQTLPKWLWIPIFIFSFSIAACNYIVAFLFGAMMVGVGISVPTLMKVIDELERNGAAYYGQRNEENGQFEIMRYIPSEPEA